MEGAHDFLGNSANTDLIRQAKGELGQAPVPTPTLETNKEDPKKGRPIKAEIDWQTDQAKTRRSVLSV